MVHSQFLKPFRKEKPQQSSQILSPMLQFSILARVVEPNAFTLPTMAVDLLLEDLAQVIKIHAYVLRTNLVLVIGNSLVDASARMWHMRRVLMSLARLYIIARMIHYGDTKMDGFNDRVWEADALLFSEVWSNLLVISLKQSRQHVRQMRKLEEAHKAFLMIHEPSAVSRNGLISDGQFALTVSAFEDMGLAGVIPYGVTVLIDLVVEYFNSMREIYGVTPEVDHYVSLVDFLG